MIAIPIIFLMTPVWGSIQARAFSKSKSIDRKTFTTAIVTAPAFILIYCSVQESRPKLRSKFYSHSWRICEGIVNLILEIVILVQAINTVAFIIITESLVTSFHFATATFKIRVPWTIVVTVGVIIIIVRWFVAEAVALAIMKPIVLVPLLLTMVIASAMKCVLQMSIAEYEFLSVAFGVDIKWSMFVLFLHVRRVG